MSKRYVIQVNLSTGENAHWMNVQHPTGGDWLTRSSSTAIADAAKLVKAGETRELRIGVSKPVYAVTPAIDMEQILAAAAEINHTDAEDYFDADDETASIAFELVDESPVLKTDDTDPDAPQII